MLIKLVSMCDLKIYSVLNIKIRYFGIQIQYDIKLITGPPGDTTSPEHYILQLNIILIN